MTTSLARRTVLLLAVALTACGTEPEAPHARAAAPEPAEIRLVSLNAWMLPLFSEDLPARLTRLTSGVGALRADVLCLQEMWSADARAQVAGSLGAGVRATTSGRGGLLTLSRFPLKDERFVPFPSDAGLPTAERIAGKGILLVTLDTPGGPLRVANTHLAFDLLAEGPRTRQLAFLAETLAPLVDLPLVLAGDLNTELSGPDGTHTPERDALRSRGFTPADPAVREATPRGARPTRVGWPRGVREAGWIPDHVLLRGAARTSLRATRFALHFDRPEDAVSDHNALVVDLVLGGG